MTPPLWLHNQQNPGAARVAIPGGLSTADETVPPGRDLGPGSAVPTIIAILFILWPTRFLRNAPLVLSWIILSTMPVLRTDHVAWHRHAAWTTIPAGGPRPRACTLQ